MLFISLRMSEPNLPWISSRELNDHPPSLLSSRFFPSSPPKMTGRKKTEVIKNSFQRCSHDRFAIFPRCGLENRTILARSFIYVDDARAERRAFLFLLRINPPTSCPPNFQIYTHGLTSVFLLRFINSFVSSDSFQSGCSVIKFVAKLNKF